MPTDYFDERSLLDIALVVSDAPSVIELVRRGALPSGTLHYEIPRLMVYARVNGFERLAQKALERSLWMGVKQKNPVLISMAHFHGISVDLKDKNQRTPLFHCVKSKAPITLIELLLKLGANPNVHDIEDTPLGIFPLLASHSQSSVPVLRLLVKHGLLPLQTFHVEDEQTTLLEFATKHALVPECIDLVRNAGSNSNLV